MFVDFNKKNKSNFKLLKLNFMKKKLLWVVLGLIVIIQFIRPTKNNNPEVSANHIYNMYATSNEVKTILDKACNDCHSNITKYPWYNNIQPVAWFVSHHVNEGKEHLNFSEFGTYNTKRQSKKLDEVIDEIKKGGMPLSSYTLIHKNAQLTIDEKATLTQWAQKILDSIK